MLADQVMHGQANSQGGVHGGSKTCGTSYGRIVQPQIRWRFGSGAQRNSEPIQGRLGLTAAAVPPAFLPASTP